MYASEVARVIARQRVPARSQRFQAYLNDVGLCDQAPGCVRSRCPTEATPTIVAARTLLGCELAAEPSPSTTAASTTRPTIKAEVVASNSASLLVRPSLAPSMPAHNLPSTGDAVFDRPHIAPCRQQSTAGV
jgi:hypothetical protein